MTQPSAPHYDDHVLLLEDDPSLSSAIAAAVQDIGFDVECFSGLDGLAWISNAKPLLIILDVSLHQTDAVEVLQALEQGGYRGAIQLMSGGHQALLDRVKRIGERRGMTMLPVLQKPFPMAKLQAAVDGAARIVAERDQPPAMVERADAGRRVDLGLALDNGWVEVWYQPKYDMRTLSLTGAECLCRVRHPDHDLMGPGAFLPSAEADDMRRLTEFVLQQACQDWSLFNAAGRGVRLAINIPCALLTAMPLARLLRQWSPKASNWPGLVLEVTEEQALRDIDAAHEIGTQLTIYGIDLAIDDFGTGYSSLSRLREIPFKEIKLDRTLVDGCAEDATRIALCRAIIELSHTLGASTVAEGVERQTDLIALRDAGCDVAQGFLLARPMTRHALEASISAGGDRGDVLSSIDRIELVA